MMHIHLFKDLKNYIWIFGTSHYRHSGDTETKQTEDWNRRVSYLKMCLLLRGGRESWLLSHSQQQYGGRFNGMINSNIFRIKVFIFFLLYHSLDTGNVATAASEIFYLGNSEVWRGENPSLSSMAGLVSQKSFCC